MLLLAMLNVGENMKERLNDLSCEELKGYLKYDINTGLFISLVSTQNKIKVGSVAGCHSRVGREKPYVIIGINKKLYFAHRLAWLYVHEEWPEVEIDHIDGDTLNNKLENLRAVDRSGNMRNRRISSNNKSGVTGVFWSNKDSRWIATIKSNQKNIYLGCFKNIQEASDCRKNAEKLYGFHENHGSERYVNHN